MPRIITAFAILASLVMCACSQESIFESLIPKQEAALAKELVAKIGSRDFSAVEEALNPDLRTPDLRAKLEQMAGMLPQGAPKSVLVIGSNTMTRAAGTTYELTLEYEYPDAWVIAAVTLERSDGKIVLQGITFTPRARSLAAENRFTFEGKGALHYIVFALAVVIPMLVVYALVLCVRTKMKQRKWLWILFIAIGLVQVHFNWTTASWNVQPVSFVLLGAGFAKSGPVAPWIFTLAFPLGAILFLVRRRSLQYHEASLPVAVAE
ncbi:hypothetical protein [Pelomonas sp. SE-A7]|uniref:hypothetical protein n=1 Tax=Pelomonas sp. SE-A7 TaxID=3054953 RepID=UPI00259CC78F|nr:hypothetical protein [Pelomonas sp. SE-A7]MDM4766569.1 hypothetical protein [Pelomonas sp. SE-A7]